MPSGGRALFLEEDVKERCDMCGQEVPIEHVCRFVPEGEHFEEMCLVVCRRCLERTGVAYWADGRFRKAKERAQHQGD